MQTPPFPNDLGLLIFHNISDKAWKEWIFMQSKIINEYKLNLFKYSHRQMLIRQMIKFLNL